MKANAGDRYQSLVHSVSRCSTPLLCLSLTSLSFPPSLLGRIIGRKLPPSLLFLQDPSLLLSAKCARIVSMHCIARSVGLSLYRSVGEAAGDACQLATYIPFFRVFHRDSNLAWVDLYLDRSAVCPILLRQMGFWQKWRSNQARG